MKIIKQSLKNMFFRQSYTKQKKVPGRDGGHRSPEWECISDFKILKFKGGKPSGGRRTKKSLTVRIYRLQRMARVWPSGREVQLV